MLGMADALVAKEDFKLLVATVSKGVKSLVRLEGERITYFVLPDKGYENCWKQIVKEENPDVIHLHGTEYPWGKSFVDNCGPDRVVVSIQGLLSAYYYYYYGLTKNEIRKNFTLYSILRGGILKGYRNFKSGGEREIALLRKVQHVIGRTSWDEARTWGINPKAKYHFCNEILRKEFYDGEEWMYEHCQPHTIFLSQAGYPIKGLHQVLRALPIVLREYPDTQLRIAGQNILLRDSVRRWLTYSDYGRIINRMIRKNGFENHVKFVGQLNAAGMKKELLSANLFVIPSTIENSPNSLGEAEILGTPCVASYVGGIPDMMKGNEDCLYRFEETEMLAKKICNVFSDHKYFRDMKAEARARHDAPTNAKRLMEIYKEIMDEGK